ncbi:uncharacterized protein LOC133355618 isoform X6 [Lethenteron reissneri]|uniref:uncharacterized protein LOC133355618 isoform X6 n=1 Tax=Lethenteron reissneri TaxID=7753 RepID=UPI002AB65BEC|nr:uncharacterized protein LOC133355618 isoform X6 [Lethenteron reissneri]
MYRIVPGLHGRQPETASVVCTSGRSRAEACRPCEAQRRPLQTAIVQSGWAMWRLPSRRGAWARATVRSKEVPCPGLGRRRRYGKCGLHLFRPDGIAGTLATRCPRSCLPSPRVAGCACCAPHGGSLSCRADLFFPMLPLWPCYPQL